MSDRFSKAMEFAGEKWGDLTTAVSTQRKLRGLQKQIADLVTERDRAMADIGRKVHALYSRGKVKNQDVLPFCKRIDAIGRQIEELNMKVREVAEPRPRGELAAAPIGDETELADEEPAAEAAPEPESEA
jgi:seryl-tRNA synthetase